MSCEKGHLTALLICHARRQKIMSEGSKFDGFFYIFLVDEGWEDPQIPLYAGHHRLPAKLHLNGVSLAC